MSTPASAKNDVISYSFHNELENGGQDSSRGRQQPATHIKEEEGPSTELVKADEVECSNSHLENIM